MDLQPALDLELALCNQQDATAAARHVALPLRAASAAEPPSPRTPHNPAVRVLAAAASVRQMPPARIVLIKAKVQTTGREGAPKKSFTLGPAITTEGLVLDSDGLKKVLAIQDK